MKAAMHLVIVTTGFLALAALLAILFGARADAARQRPAHHGRHWQRVTATWYGPGFYGHHTACGQTLRQGTIGVAHRSLPCGAHVVLRYHHRAVNATVIDRGPYSAATFDMAPGTAKALCHCRRPYTMRPRWRHA